MKSNNLKSYEIKAVLVVSVFTLGMALSACGKDKQVDIIETTEPVIESVVTVPESTVEEILETQGIEVEVIDPNLDTTMSGTYYVVDEKGVSIYGKPSNDSTSITGKYPFDTKLNVSGLYGGTGLFEVVDEDGEILGYVDSMSCDTVKGGYVVKDDTTDVSTNPSGEVTTPSDGEVTTPSEPTPIHPIDTDAIIDSLTGSDGIIGNFDWSAYGGGESYDSPPVDPNDFGLGTGEGGTPHVLD